MVEWRSAGVIQPAAIETRAEEDGTLQCVLSGHWTWRGMESVLPRIETTLQLCRGHTGVAWDLRRVSALDRAAALLLWRAWGAKRPQKLFVREEHRCIFQRIEALGSGLDGAPKPSFSARLSGIFLNADVLFEHVVTALALLGRLLGDLRYFIAHPSRIPWLEISATVYHAGARALSITCLVGLLVGVVISYLVGLQLKNFGAEFYIVKMLGIGILRELGPLLAAVLVAGRSGSAMTAQLGVMRVTQELDALAVLGISQTVRLVWPKVIALAVAMPLVVLWTNFNALAGGMAIAHYELEMGFFEFLVNLPGQVPQVNVWIGLGKGVVFGIVIALVACHFGFRIEPNTSSLAKETTNSVVTAITLVILIDAVFAVMLRNVGFR